MSHISQTTREISLLSTRSRGTRSLTAWAGCSCAFILLFFGATLIASPAEAQRGYEKRIRPTATPTVNRSANLQRAREDVYAGYAKLFVLGHIFTRAIGAGNVLPPSINLDFFAEQPYLAESGDVFIYRGSARGDVMWPLVLPTPPRETPTPIPTEIPTKAGTPVPMATATPTPSPTPTEVIPPPLKVQAISLAGDQKLVMIQDNMLSIGDAVGGATVTQIHKRYAEVIYFGKNFFVTQKGTFRPEDIRPEELSLE